MTDIQEAGTIQTIRANLNRLVDEVELKGDTHLVAPAVAVREGILEYPGDRRELLPSEEIANSAYLWNHTPVTVGHPTDGKTNKSATQPEVFDESAVGIFLDASFDKSESALKGNVYLNREWLNQHERGDEIIQRIKNGDPIEVSTAYRAPDSVKENGKFEGQRYNRIQRGIEPDHFALLLDEEGNCSIEDGCGFPRRNHAHYTSCCDNCGQGEPCESNQSQEEEKVEETNGQKFMNYMKSFFTENQDIELESNESEEDMDDEQDEQVENEQSENEESDEAEEEATEQVENSNEDEIDGQADEDGLDELDLNEDQQDKLEEIVDRRVEEKLEENDAINQVSNSVEKQRESHKKAILANSEYPEEMLENKDLEELRILRRSVTDSHQGVVPNSDGMKRGDSHLAPEPKTLRDSEE